MVTAPLEDLVVALDLSNTLVRSLDGQIRFWSAGCQKLYGWTKQDAIGRRSHELLCTKFPEPLAAINVALTASGIWSGNLLHRTKGNCIINVASQWTFNPATSIVIEQCIDARGSQSHLASLVDSSNDAVIGETLDGIVTSWNPAAQRLFDYASAEIIGQPVEILFPSALHDEEKRLIARIRNGETVNHYETTRISKAGKCLDISLTLSPIFDYAGQLVGISKIARDITSERAHKREIYLAMERQRLAAEAGEVGLWNFSPSTLLLEWNDRHKILFGIEPDAPTPSLEDFMLFVHPEDESHVRIAFENVVTDRSEIAIDYRIIRSDGAMRWITTTGKLHHDPVQLDSVVLGTSIDVTPRRLHEEALRRANSSLEEFAYAAAHDLQEPLRNISLSLQELAAVGANATNEERIEMMDIAVRNSNRMQTLIKDLLSFSRALDAVGDVVANTDANVVLAVVNENLFRSIQENSAQITVESPLPEVPMLYSHLLQLMQNLIANSLKYRKPDGSLLIRVHARQERSQVTFVISDNGIGIAPQYHQRIFGVFKRLDHSQPGNGIGLAVCKRIVEHYGGNIWVESAEGEGATFLFSIPYSRKGGST